MFSAFATVLVLATPPTWSMTLSVAVDGIVRVEGCATGSRIAGVRVATARGRAALRSAEAELKPDERVPLSPSPDGAWVLPDGTAECVTLTFDRAALARPPMALDWSFDPRDVLISPVGGAGPSSIRIVGAAERRLWVPWPSDSPNTYQLPESAFRLPGHAFIRPSFASRTVTASGSAVELSVADGFTSLDLDGADRWLRRALALHAGLFTVFPCPRWSLVVVPAPPGATGRDSPVVFGTTSRGGGPHIVAWVPADVRADSLPGEWVLVHELFHLAQPWIEDDWFAEGLATYYGEVLRVRGGVLTPVQFWTALLDGFRRGASVGGASTLGDEEHEMVARRTFWRVYWGGAAIAFLSDVELRLQNAGSLDVGVRALAARLELTDARSAMAAIAEATGDDALATIATPALAATGFPDVAATLTALGVRAGPGGVTLDHSAPLVAIRRAIESGAVSDPPKAPIEP